MLLDNATFVAVWVEARILSAMRVHQGKLGDIIYRDLASGDNDFGAAIHEFAGFLGDEVLVVYNANNDLKIIKSRLAEVGKAPLDNRVVCMSRIASRLWPGSGIASVKEMEEKFCLEPDPFMSYAEAVAQLFLRSFSLLDALHDVGTMDAVLKFQHWPHHKVRSEPKHIQRLRKVVLPKVPRTPGVYRMYGSTKQLLYVGKAKDLAQRVRSYYAGIPNKDHRTRRLVQAANHLEWTSTKTELSAMLLELQLRKKHQPPFNRADAKAHSKRFSGLPFVRLGVTPKEKQIQVVRQVLDDGGRYYGPFSDNGQAEIIFRAFSYVYGTATKPVIGLRASHHATVLSAEGLKDVQAFLEHSETKILETLMVNLVLQRVPRRHLDFCHKHLFALNALERKRFITEVPVHDRTGLVLRFNSNVVEVHRIHFGYRAGEVILKRTLSHSGWHRFMEQQVQTLFDTEDDGRRSLQEIDEMRLLSLWLDRESDNVHVVLKKRESTDREQFKTKLYDVLEREGMDLL